MIIWNNFKLKKNIKLIYWLKLIQKRKKECEKWKLRFLIGKISTIQFIYQKNNSQQILYQKINYLKVRLAECWKIIETIVCFYVDFIFIEILCITFWIEIFVFLYFLIFHLLSLKNLMFQYLEIILFLFLFSEIWFKMKFLKIIFVFVLLLIQHL